MTPVPVNDPVKEPVNGSVILLNCVDDEIVPAAAPPADATYEAVSAKDAEVPVNALNCAELLTTSLNLLVIEL